MTLISRVSLIGSRIGLLARNQSVNNNVRIADKVKSSFSRAASTESTSSTSSRSRTIANVALGGLVVGAGVGTVLFTYLRLKDGGMGVAANTIMDDGLHPASYPWPNSHPFATFDHARYENSSLGN